MEWLIACSILSARFEYHPENRGSRFEVLLGQLGTEKAQRHGLPPDVNEREQGLDAPFPLKGQVSIANPVNVVVNDSFISPLVELFGDVSVGHEVFVASNTILRADLGTRVCIGNETNLQANISLIVLRSRPNPPTECGPHSSSTEERVRVAHQVTIRTGAIVVGVTLRDGVTVPDGAVITTQAQTDQLK